MSSFAIFHPPIKYTQVHNYCGGEVYLLLGCGDVGLAAADKLKESGAEITIVDRDPKRVRWLKEMGYKD
jgi:threonine dehydrogenase-like Zn-dependent dehydrogenase